MSNWKLNKGDWTEAYVFCKLLADGRIYSGDENLQKVVTAYLDIVKVLRKNAGVRTEYKRENDYVIASVGGTGFVTVKVTEFKMAAENLLKDIKDGGDRAFMSERTEVFLKELLHIVNVKEKCVDDGSDDKTDILLQVSNSSDGCTELVGFSIKSHLGSPATLFNYSKASKLVYKIKGCDEEIMHILNSMTNSKGGCDLEQKIAYIKNKPELDLEFMGSKIIDNTKYGDIKETGPFFRWNLEHYDVNMLLLFNAMLLSSYGYYDKPSGNGIQDIVNAVADINPLGVHSPNTVYKTKFKDFLFCAFAGLTASKKWDGTRKINGGYIDVHRDGEVLYYRAVSDEQFTTYLYNNIKLERPEHGCISKLKIAEAELYLNHTPIPQAVIDKSLNSSKKKGDYGYVYLDETHYDESCYCIDINFSFRFKK